MKTYARIDDGKVREIYTPPAEHADLPIDELFHSSLQWVDVTNVSPKPEFGWSYDRKKFAPPPPPVPPSPQERAVGLLRQPITVSCDPAIDGSYAIDDATRMQMTAIAAAIGAGLGLPGGGDTFNWPDANGKARQWKADQFLGFVKAVMNFVYANTQVVQKHSKDLPSSTLKLS